MTTVEISHAIDIGATQTLTLTGPFEWLAGVMYGPGTLATTDITTFGSYVSVDAGLTWINRGTVLDDTSTSDNPYATESFAVINQAPGTFDITGGGTFGFGSYVGDIMTFTNAGLLEATAGGGSFAGFGSNQLVLDSSGTVLASAGNLVSKTNGTLGGLITTTADGTLTLEGNLAMTGSVANTGSLVVTNGGTILLATAVETIPGVFDQNGGTLLPGAGDTLDSVGDRDAGDRNDSEWGRVRRAGNGRDEWLDDHTGLSVGNRSKPRGTRAMDARRRRGVEQ